MMNSEYLHRQTVHGLGEAILVLCRLKGSEQPLPGYAGIQTARFRLSPE